MISIVDTHCHLDLEAFSDDRDQVVKRALDAGVHAMLLIGYNAERWESTSALSRIYPFMLRAVGLHPNDADMWNRDLEQSMLREIEATAPVAVGEIGLDFYRSSDNRDRQVQAFDRQIQIAKERGLPIIIHQRSAEADVLEVLKRYRPLQGVMHCFTGDEAYAHECLDIGMHLGIGGVVTFPKSDGIRAAVESAPENRIILETDAPFLAPQDMRGKRNEPAHTLSIAETVAHCRRTSTELIAEQTTRNATSLFGEALADAVRSGMEYQ